jgi:hypothetical protein
MKKYEDKLISEEYTGLTYIEYVYILGHIITFLNAEGLNEQFRKMAIVGITFPAFMKLFEKFYKKTNKKFAKKINTLRPILSTLYFGGVLQTIFVDWQKKSLEIVPELSSEQKRKAEQNINRRQKMYTKVKEYLPSFIHGPVLEDLHKSVNLYGKDFDNFIEQRLRLMLIPLYNVITNAEQTQNRDDWVEVAFKYYIFLGGKPELSRNFVLTSRDIDENLILNNPTKSSRFDEKTCSICLESLNNQNFIEATCGHRFHKKCAKQWKGIKNSCPLCKQTNVFFGK